MPYKPPWSHVLLFVCFVFMLIGSVKIALKAFMQNVECANCFIFMIKFRFLGMLKTESLLHSAVRDNGYLQWDFNCLFLNDYIQYIELTCLIKYGPKMAFLTPSRVLFISLLLNCIMPRCTIGVAYM